MHTAAKTYDSDRRHEPDKKTVKINSFSMYFSFSVTVLSILPGIKFKKIFYHVMKNQKKSFNNYSLLGIIIVNRNVLLYPRIFH